MADNGGRSADHNSTKGKVNLHNVFQFMTPEEHVFQRPDLYIGSMEMVTQTMSVCEFADTCCLVPREVTFVPALLKIFDEILVNAADNKKCNNNMDCIKIDINHKKNKISVWNNGNGIPIEIFKDGIYLPTLCFGHLRFSSNYNDDEKKQTGGRNGIGAKVSNMFSNKFTVETSCQQTHFMQTWSDNMSKVSVPDIMSSEDEDFTCITFYPDLKKFKMELLDTDIVALMSRRAYDIAGCTKGITVKLNGKQIPLKNFKDYVHLYTKNKEDEDGNPLKIAYENVNESWEVAATISDCGFQQVSFVNNIATTKGGRHVEHVVRQLVDRILNAVAKKNDATKVTPTQIKTHIWLFVNCLIDNPIFDSPTKETLVSHVKSFGSECALSRKFMTSMLKCGVVEAVISCARLKAQTGLKKKRSKKLSKLRIPKLEDANDAGTSRSKDCTLILTEGDSAKSLAVSGLGVIGRNKFGVFPLKGKILNVREATQNQIDENDEINNLMQVMGLNYDLSYESDEDMETLRYGRLMIMADQDHDGSHIKGLLINFIHFNWPSLLQSSFLEQFITPIVKASKGKIEESFFSLAEFEEWKKNTANVEMWKLKYYKGLGTSTAKEAKEYFSNMPRHRIEFKYQGPQDDYAIELAFSKKLIKERKIWLGTEMEKRKNEPETYLYRKNTTYITYSDFIYKEFVLFSNMDNERSIPSLVDGFKPGQRKVLFTCFKRNDKRDVKVAQLAGSVAEHSSYHHGEISLTSTIINLAQNFVGSNNINLLQPLGQFGTRLQGGKDAANARYVYTMLSPLARLLFSSLDEPRLKHLYEANQKIEPEYYVPIIPMVLVNGADGIGTAWSTKIPNFNPRVIVKNLLHMLDSEQLEQMLPWYKNFKGTIVQSDAQHFAVYGEIARLDNNKIEITELPIRMWTQTYRENVLELMLPGGKVPASILSYEEFHTDTTVRFVISMNDDQLQQAESQGFHKKFKLQSSIATSSMVLFDHKGRLQTYETAIDILKEFFIVRLEMYKKRKDYLIGMLNAEAKKLINQEKFILERIEKTLAIEDCRKIDIIKMLKVKGYDSDPVKAWKEACELQNEDDQEAAGPSKEEHGPPREDEHYDYLFGITMLNLTREKKEELQQKLHEKNQELHTLQRKSPSDLWREDLNLFIDALDTLEKKEKEDEVSQCAVKAKGKGKTKKITKEDTKPSMNGERVAPPIHLEADVKSKKKGHKKNKEKDFKVEEDGDDPLVPLSERIENLPKKEPAEQPTDINELKRKLRSYNRPTKSSKASDKEADE